jgi:hypothetical protein
MVGLLMHECEAYDGTPEHKHSAVSDVLMPDFTHARRRQDQ